MEFLQQCVNGLVQGAIYALIALGYTMVYGVLRFINFAHGDVYMLGAYFGYFTARWLGTGALLSDKSGNAQAAPFLHIALILLFSMVGAAVVGVVIERFAYRPLRNAPRLTALITAIGVSMFLEYGAQALFSPNPQSFPKLITEAPVPGTNGLITQLQLVIIVVAVALMLALQFLVFKTATGRALRAVALDRSAAQLMGINTDAVIATTFAIGSALAAAAAVLGSTYQNTIDPLVGIAVGLKAFIAAVLGGIGSIQGAVLGGLILGLAETAVGATDYSAYRDAVAFALLILILLLRPAGLLGKTAAEKV
ncbi:MAG TPA: branched-chain amino acid ABC transporter permease [Abditibacteriaceae bacterium]|jgi:branched-chain amino acid transport system permease protein